MRGYAAARTLDGAGRLRASGHAASRATATRSRTFMRPIMTQYSKRWRLPSDADRSPNVFEKHCARRRCRAVLCPNMISKPPSSRADGQFRRRRDGLYTLDGIGRHPKVKLACVAEVDPRGSRRREAEVSRTQSSTRTGASCSTRRRTSTRSTSRRPTTCTRRSPCRRCSRACTSTCQKPLTQTIYEARQLTESRPDEEARHADGHPDPLAPRVHRTVVALIQDGAIGKVKEVHTWSGKQWGDTDPRPTGRDPVPARLELGPVARRRGGAAVHRRRLLPPRRTGGSGSTSAPAPSATWAATSSTRSSTRWP